MLVTTLWAYQTTYKVTTQYTPFKLVYDTQIIMLIEFVIPTKIIRDLSKSSGANGQLLEYNYINFNVDEILKKYWLEGSMYMGCSSNEYYS
jgi:hypothetical protein